MIEGLVMDVYKNYVIVMTHGGEYLKLRKKGIVNVGDIYTGNIYRTFSPSYAAAAAVLFIATTFGGYTAYAHQIVGVVDISGSKSIKLYVNRAGKIQKVEGVSDSNNLKNSTVDNALNEINKIARQEGLFESNKEITVQAKKLKPSKVNFDEVKSKLQNAVDSKQLKHELKDNSKVVPDNNKNPENEIDNSKKNDKFQNKNNNKDQNKNNSNNKNTEVKPSNNPKKDVNTETPNKNVNEKKNNKDKEKTKTKDKNYKYN